MAMLHKRAVLLPFLVALLYGVVLAFIPLLQELHFLSAALTALISAFVSGLAAARMSFVKTPASGLRAAFLWLLVSLAPALPLLAGSLIRGCFSADGLAYWILIPGPSALFGFALGRYFAFSSKRPVLYTVLTMLFIAIGITLIELLNYPQIFFHNHVWGYWPGPVYDDVVELNPSVLFFRYITLAWTALLWLLPFFYGRKSVRWPFLLIAISLMLSYLNMSRTGIIHPEEFIQQDLGAVLESRYATIYYDHRINETEAAHLGRLHDFHISELTEILGMDPQELPRIRSYVYLHEWQKKRLTGAGNTVYVPVWNRNPQMHIHQRAVDAVLRHELVHVLAREFGMPVLNASPNVALIEGLAVALQTERNTSASLHQIVAAQDTLPDARMMSALMSPAGFYKLSGSLSYTLAGSFTAWLLDTYDPALFRSAYARGSISGAYGRSVEELVKEWHQFLRTIDTDPAQLAVSDQVFSAPGITELKCVFHPRAAWRAMQQSGRLLFEKGEEAGYEFLTAHIANSKPERITLAIWNRWAQLGLRLGRQDDVAAKLAQHGSERSARLSLIFADALFLSGDEEGGLNALEETGMELQASQRFRLNADLRDYWLALEYGTLPDDAAETEAGITQLTDPAIIPYLLRYCVRFNRTDRCREFGLVPKLVEWNLSRYYPVYEAYIKTLIAQSYFKEAEVWITALKEQAGDDVLHLSKFKRLTELKRMVNYSSK